MAIAGFSVPDSVGRVFYPNQPGHAMIANLVLYQMRARKALSLKELPPPQDPTSLGDSCQLPPSPACNATLSRTWTSRDAADAGVTAFCASHLSVKGAAGKTTSGVFNDPKSLDYMSVSIAWEDDVSIGENQCNAWFKTVIDGCSIPTATDNRDNWKHGGSIGFADNATLSIEPLVIRRLWDKPKSMDPHCNGLDNNHYVTHDTLRDNIKDYCSESARQIVAVGGSTFAKEYNAQTPDHLSLTRIWPTGPMSFQVFEEECIYYLATIMDGCDVPSPSSHPLNWKYGG